MTDKREFLAQLPIFADLSEASLEAVAHITREYAFPQDAVIAYQRDIGHRFYVVKEGRLYARALDNSGIVRDADTKSYLPGQYSNDLWLFTPTIHAATIIGKGPDPHSDVGGRLYVIEGPEFIQLLRRYPAIIDELAPREEEETRYGLSDAAWTEAQKLKLRPRRVKTSVGGALLPEERLELFTRRSWWFLLGQLIPPFILIIAAAVILFITPTETGLERAAKVGVPILFTIIGLAMGLIRLLDFRADYFIITNRHLTHHEYELRHFRILLVKVPIGQVQTVEILIPSLLANLVNIGTARVTTAAVTGVVLFDNIDNPVAVKETLDRLTSQYKSQESAQTQAVMLQSIEKHFGVGPQMMPTDPNAPPPLPPPRRVLPFAGLRRRFGWRVVEGNVITYRKSIFILLRQVALPVFFFVLLGALTGLGIYMAVTPWVLLSVVAILAFANFIFFIWRLENWRNDIFQLTDRFVLDVDRKPFGFGESRKQAAINNITNVGANRPGFLPTLFNYGFVNIDTAGAASEIVFVFVPNPELIQSDIFQRIDEARRQQRVQEGSTRRQEYAVLLDVYRQAMEQHRIPQRTPTDFEET